MMWPRVCRAGLLLFLIPVSAFAQANAAADAVRSLVTAASQPSPMQGERIRQAAAALRAALVPWDEALATLTTAAAREIPTASTARAFQLRVELGLAYRTRGRFLDAIREFDAAAKLDPAASELHLLRGLTLESAGREDEAAVAFREAWRHDPTNPLKAYHAFSRRGLAAAAEERGRALDVLENAYRTLIDRSARPVVAPLAIADIFPDWASPTPIVGDERTGAGFGLVAAGRYSEAVTSLSGGRAEQSSPLAHFQRAQTLEAAGQVSDARREYAAALAGTLAGRGVIHVAIARLARVEGDSAQAITEYSQAVRLNPNDTTMRLELASAHAAGGDSDAAFAEIVGGLLSNPSSAPLHAALGQLRLDTGHPAEAVLAFTRALELAPDQYELRYALATALTRLGKSAEAAAQLQLFDRVRREQLERRRQTIQNEVDRNEKSTRRGRSR